MRYLIKGKSPAIEAKLAALVPGMVCISVMTRAELQYGLKRLPADPRLHLTVRQFLKIVRVLLCARDCESIIPNRLKKRLTTEDTKKIILLIQ